ncbi:MAG: hypothetical protein K0M40_03860 [Prolixibacteraceae bacterium]|nr:hypothetical protein [Prolixibacteraceae bacterium]
MNHALEQLIRLQQCTGIRLGSPEYSDSIYTKVLADTLKDFAPEDRKELETFVPSSLPTKYENPVYYFKLYLAARQLDKLLEKFSSELSSVLCVPQFRKDIVIGTIPLRSVNAMVCQFDTTGEVLICFRTGLFEFLNELTNLVFAMMKELGPAVGTIPAETQRWTALSFDQDSLVRYLDSHPKVRAAFIQIMIQFGTGVVSKEHSQIWRTAFPETGRDTELDWFQHYMHMFVLGHEYGHLLAGHLSEKKAELCMVGGVQVENQRHSYQEELEADLIGIAFVGSFLRSIGMQNQEELIVSSFFLSAADLLQRVISVIYTGFDMNRPVSSHPPPFGRRWKLQTSLVELLVDDQRAAVAVTFRSAKMLEFVLETLWMHSMDEIYRELARFPASPDWAEIDCYPGGVESIPYTMSTRDEHASRKKMNRSVERGAFHYGQFRAMLFLAPYAVAEGYATDADTRSVEKSALSALLRFTTPAEAQVLGRQGLRADAIFELEEKILPNAGEIKIAADLGSLIVSAGHFPHPAAQRIFSGMARSINANSTGLANRLALPDELRVWRAINELCSIAICGIVPSQKLLYECTTIIEWHYSHE